VVLIVTVCASPRRPDAGHEATAPCSSPPARVKPFFDRSAAAWSVSPLISILATISLVSLSVSAF
jgi:hypothetical protein